MRSLGFVPDLLPSTDHHQPSSGIHAPKFPTIGACSYESPPGRDSAPNCCLFLLTISLSLLHRECHSIPCSVLRLSYGKPPVMPSPCQVTIPPTYQHGQDTRDAARMERQLCINVVTSQPPTPSSSEHRHFLPREALLVCVVASLVRFGSRALRPSIPFVTYLRQRVGLESISRPSRKQNTALTQSHLKSFPGSAFSIRQHYQSTYTDRTIDLVLIWYQISRSTHRNEIHSHGCSIDCCMCQHSARRCPIRQWQLVRQCSGTNHVHQLGSSWHIQQGHGYE